MDASGPRRLKSPDLGGAEAVHVVGLVAHTAAVAAVIRGPCSSRLTRRGQQAGAEERRMSTRHARSRRQCTPTRAGLNNRNMRPERLLASRSRLLGGRLAGPQPASRIGERWQRGFRCWLCLAVAGVFRLCRSGRDRGPRLSLVTPVRCRPDDRGRTVRIHRWPRPCVKRVRAAQGTGQRRHPCTTGPSH